MQRRVGRGRALARGRSRAAATALGGARRRRRPRQRGGRPARAARRPSAAVRCSAKVGVDVVEQGEEGGGVLAVAGGQQPPAGRPERSAVERLGPGGGSRAPPARAVGAGRDGRVWPVTRQLPPPGDPTEPVPTRPHYPRRMPGMPTQHGSDAVRLSRARGYLRRGGARQLTGQLPPRREPGPRSRASPAALAAVRSGDADAALVPLENSVEGSVPATMDGLADGDPLVITREVFLEVALRARRPARARRRPTCAPWPAIRTPSPRPRPAGRAAARRRRRCPRPRPPAPPPRSPRASTTPPSARRSPPSGTGSTALADDVADHPGAVTRFVLVQRRRAAARADRQRQDVAASPWSATAPVRCWSCSASSPSAGSS